MTQILAVYFSRTATTRALARQIAVRLPLTEEEITEPTPRRGLIAYLRSGFQALFSRPVPIAPSQYNPARFALTLVGTPNWAGHPCAPVRSWLIRHRKSIGDYAIFVTQGGSGAEHVIARITRIIGHPPRATLVVNQDQIGLNKIGQAGPKIDTFLATLAEETDAIAARRPHPA